MYIIQVLMKTLLFWEQTWLNGILLQCKGHNSRVLAGLWLVIRLSWNTTLKNIISKSRWLLFDLESEQGKGQIEQIWEFNCHNSKVLTWIWLVIKLCWDIMHTNITTKFDENPMKPFWLSEWTTCGSFLITCHWSCLLMGK